MRTLRISAATLFAALVLTVSASAQTQVSFEARGGFAVPTFDISDAADPGPVFGGGLMVHVGSGVKLMADADFGLHPGANNGPDVNVYHFMGKIGYDVLASQGGPVSLILNAGAGIMMFDVDVAGADAETYFGINAGAKIGYAVTPQVTIFASPQGDIAFSDDPSTSWVWPFAAGVRFTFSTSN